MMSIESVAKMQHKYEPHIRVKFSLFEDPQFITIPNKQRANAFLVFICLLKFANSKTLTCYPRKATIANMSGLSRTTVYRTTKLLEKAGIIHKKRLKSTLLYTINAKYIVGYRDDVSKRNTNVSNWNTGVSDRSLLEELSYKTNISNFIRVLAEGGSDTNHIIEQIAYEYPPEQLKKAIDNNDNPYLCKKALEIQEENNKTYISIDPKIVDNVRKKTNYFYKNKVAKNKKEYGRVQATKSFLSRSNKKK